MKKKQVILVGMMLSAAFAFSATAPSATASVSSTASDPHKDKEQIRSLSGTVQDKGDQPVANAIVYLKNTKTLTVKTYITDAQGAYHFHALSRNVDYEIFAEIQGQRSSTKTLSSFDSRNQAVINLRVDAGKK